MLPFSAEMEHLTVCVHTGIGASAAVNSHVAFKDRLQVTLNHVLHGTAVWLALPTAVMPAVVGANALPALEVCDAFGRRGDHFNHELDRRPRLDHI
jgi:hypothetical protein